jgi:hypothetical protein
MLSSSIAASRLAIDKHEKPSIMISVFLVVFRIWDFALVENNTARRV